VDLNGILQQVTITSTGAAVSYSPPKLNPPGSVFFDSVEYVVPAGGVVNLTISGVRVAIATLSGMGTSFLSGTVVAPSFGVTSLPLPLAQSAPTLLTSVLNYGIPCLGSPVPSTLNFANLSTGGTSVSTIRITEASPGAFSPRAPTADFGVRFLVNLAGYGQNAQVYVPDVIVGYSGTVPTTAGEYATIPNGGTYTFGFHQLLLSRVSGADATGNGGTLFAAPPGGVTNFTTVTQVPLVNGAGSVTYEVIDANPNSIASAQIPVFVGVPATSCSTVQANTLGATLAPASNVSVATPTDPIPRYVAFTPTSDCTFSGDCTASYFPVLQAAPASITLSSSSLGQTKTGFITVTNGGTSQLTFTAATTYQTAANLSVANWLSINGTTGSPVIGIVDPSLQINGFGLNLSANPAALLIPGTYQATVTINGGSAGTVAVPVTFDVGPAGPVIQALVNGASFQSGAVSAGSVASIFGLNLAPKTSTPATVTFSGSPATILYDGATQINVLVPTALGSAAPVGVIATIDGVASNNFPVSLVPNAPAVFNSGILNQNNSVNSASAPASRGDEIQIFLTGLATPIPLPVTVNIGSVALTGSQLIYLGPTGGTPPIPGLEQINVQVPAGLTGSSVPLSICVPGASGQPVCSSSASLFVH